jgi:hypothetical protein
MNGLCATSSRRAYPLKRNAPPVSESPGRKINRTPVIMNFPFHFIIPTDKIAEGCRQFKKMAGKTFPAIIN